MEENEVRTQTIFSIAMTGLLSLALFIVGALLCALGTVGTLPIVFLVGGTILWGWCAIDLLAVQRKNSVLALQTVGAASGWVMALASIL